MNRYSAFSKRIRNTLIMIFVGVILMGNKCYVISNVDQPDSVLTGSSFNVNIDILGTNEDKDPDENLTANGIIGILLPEGWTVKDSIVYSEVDNYRKGFLIYEPLVVTFLNNMGYIEVPPKLHWWGGISTNMLDGNDFSGATMTITIQTDKKDGNYNLQYVFGDNSFWNDAHPYCIVDQSNSIPICSVISHLKTSRQNEEWEIYPNPSKGQIYIRLANFANDVFLKVYDMSSRLQESCILHESLSRMDLSALSKGTYIVSLENHGEVKTKRLVIQ